MKNEISIATVAATALLACGCTTLRFDCTDTAATGIAVRADEIRIASQRDVVAIVARPDGTLEIESIDTTEPGRCRVYRASIFSKNPGGIPFSKVSSLVAAHVPFGVAATSSTALDPAAEIKPGLYTLAQDASGVPRLVPLGQLPAKVAQPDPQPGNGARPPTLAQVQWLRKANGELLGFHAALGSAETCASREQLEQRRAQGGFIEWLLLDEDLLVTDTDLMNALEVALPQPGTQPECVTDLLVRFKPSVKTSALSLRVRRRDGALGEPVVAVAPPFSGPAEVKLVPPLIGQSIDLNLKNSHSPLEVRLLPGSELFPLNVSQTVNPATILMKGTGEETGKRFPPGGDISLINILPPPISERRDESRTGPLRLERAQAFLNGDGDFHRVLLFFEGAKSDLYALEACWATNNIANKCFSKAPLDGSPGIGLAECSDCAKKATAERQTVCNTANGNSLQLVQARILGSRPDGTEEGQITLEIGEKADSRTIYAFTEKKSWCIRLPELEKSP